MQAKRSWPHIELGHVNLLLYLLIAGIVVFNWSSIRWAAIELPHYLDGDIWPPQERTLTLDAVRMISDGEASDEARIMLERSLAIDPLGDASYWLGRYHHANDELDQAAIYFRSILDKDPSLTDAYVRLAEIRWRRGELIAARGVVREGLAYFEANAERYRPRPDNFVDAIHNRSAEALHDHYVRSIDRLKGVLAQMDDRAPGPEAPPAEVEMSEP